MRRHRALAPAPGPGVPLRHRAAARADGRRSTTRSCPGRRSDTVTLDASRIGNQLIIPADVKYNGVLVGRVSSVHSNGDGRDAQPADLEVADHEHPEQRRGPDPARRRCSARSTSTWSAQPTRPRAPLPPGDTIQQDHSDVAVELQTVFQKLMPVLRAANPRDLSVALANTASALRGRGNELGKNLRSIDRYFTAAQPRPAQHPARHQRAGRPASNYADAAPDLLRILQQLLGDGAAPSPSSGTLRAVPGGHRGLREHGTQVLREERPGPDQARNSQRRPAQPALEVLDRPRVPAQGPVDLRPGRDSSTPSRAASCTSTLIPVNDRGAYTQEDRPTLKQFTTPTLPAELLRPAVRQPRPAPRELQVPVRTRRQLQPGRLTSVLGAVRTRRRLRLSPARTAGVGSPAEQNQIAALLAAIAGRQPSSSGLDDLLLGPLLRGMAVSP